VDVNSTAPPASQRLSTLLQVHERHRFLGKGFAMIGFSNSSLLLSLLVVSAAPTLRSTRRTQLRRYPLTICAVCVAPICVAQSGGVSPLQVIQSAQSALRGNGSSLDAIRLSGAVQYSPGSKTETGTINLISLANGTAKTEISVPSGSHIDLRFPVQDAAKSLDLEPNSKPVAIEYHNLLIAGNWFFPEHLITRLIDPARAVKVASSQQCSTTEICIESQYSTTNAAAAKLTGQMSSMTVSLNPSTSLPERVDYNAHPNDRPNVDVPIEVRYDDYRNISGHMIPFHVQKYVNGSLFLDINITNADLDATISPSELTGGL
jgi:hypothetical protein